MKSRNGFWFETGQKIRWSSYSPSFNL